MNTKVEGKQKEISSTSSQKSAGSYYGYDLHHYYDDEYDYYPNDLLNNKDTKEEEEPQTTMIYGQPHTFHEDLEAWLPSEVYKMNDAEILDYAAEHGII